jgi:hypothetical protein
MTYGLRNPAMADAIKAVRKLGMAAVGHYTDRELERVLTTALPFLPANEDDMTTPEGRTKRSIDRVLKAFDFVYAFKPVQMGIGARGVDYHCVAGVAFLIDGEVHHLPIAFFIEAKKPDGEVTAIQANFLRDRREKQHCKTFVIDDDNVTLHELVEWLELLESQNERTLALAPAHIG